jgi:excisionase family DNA binding protein
MTTSPTGAGGPQPLLSIRQAAAFFGVSEKTVRRRIAAGHLRAHLIGRQWRIAPEEVERFLLTRSNWHRCFVS